MATQNKTVGTMQSGTGSRMFGKAVLGDHGSDPTTDLNQIVFFPLTGP